MLLYIRKPSTELPEAPATRDRPRDPRWLRQRGASGGAGVVAAGGRCWLILCGLCGITIYGGVFHQIPVPIPIPIDTYTYHIPIDTYTYSMLPIPKKTPQMPSIQQNGSKRGKNKKMEA